MDRGCFSRYSWVDFAFSVVGVCTFLLDWGSDMWVAAELYLRGELLWFGLLVGLMGVSSAVVQMFSWFWFRYDRELPGFGTGTGTGAAVLFGDREKLFCLLHVLQLGFLCRHIWAIRQGFKVWWRKQEGSEFAVYLSHDLSMLRLIETFCESAPQLTLMIYVMLRTNKARTVQFVSVAASATSISWMVVDYHRSLRSFVPDKAQQGWASSLVYFLWNLLLIAPRLVVLALFWAVLDGSAAVHFLLLWSSFLLWAWKQRTDFMDSAGGEWLYRATVGLIWYFSWFNVAEGRTRGRSLIYHSFMAADGALLLGTWWFYRDPVQTEAYGPALLLVLPLASLLGLLLKALYYCCFHPRLWRPPLRDPAPDLPDTRVPFRDASAQDDPFRDASAQLTNRRMARHAKLFYGHGGTDRGTDRLTDRGTNRLTDPLTDRLTDRGTDPLTDLGTNRLTDPLTDRLTDRGTDQGADRLTDRGTDRLTDRGTDPLTDLGTNRLTDPLTDRLTDRGTDQGADRLTDRGADRGTDGGTDPLTDPLTDRGTDQGADRLTDRGTD